MLISNISLKKCNNYTTFDLSSPLNLTSKLRFKRNHSCSLYTIKTLLSNYSLFGVFQLGFTGEIAPTNTPWTVADLNSSMRSWKIHFFSLLNYHVVLIWREMCVANYSTRAHFNVVSFSTWFMPTYLSIILHITHTQKRFFVHIYAHHQFAIH